MSTEIDADNAHSQGRISGVDGLGRVGSGDGRGGRNRRNPGERSNSHKRHYQAAVDRAEIFFMIFLVLVSGLSAYVTNSNSVGVGSHSQQQE